MKKIYKLFSLFRESILDYHFSKKVTTVDADLYNNLKLNSIFKSEDFKNESLKNEYNFYKENISSGGSAASYEMSCFLDQLIRTKKYRNILNLGSGFSSFVFRKYQNDNKGVKVWCVDSDKQWLIKTASFLERNSLSTNLLFHWDDFLKQKIIKFDIIFLDIRPVKRRVDNINYLLSILNQDGVLVVDDVHKPQMRYGMLKETKKNNNKIINLKKYTFDEYQRYGAIILP